jgi:hypothetical protein
MIPLTGLKSANSHEVSDTPRMFTGYLVNAPDGAKVIRQTLRYIDHAAYVFSYDTPDGAEVGHRGFRRSQGIILSFHLRFDIPSSRP